MSPSRCTRSVECDMNGGAGLEGCSGCEFEGMNGGVFEGGFEGVFEGALEGEFDCTCEVAAVVLAVA